jgi:NarL family two-component system response regulator LiaR
LVLIHEYAIVREGLRALLERCEGFEVAGEGDTCDDALEILAREFAEVVLVHNDSLDRDCMETVSALGEQSPQSRVIILTSMHDPELHRRAIQCGAAGLFLKNQGSDLLIKAINKVAEGEVWLDRSIIAVMLNNFRRNAVNREEEQSKIGTLTGREREIITLVCEGLRNQEIADRLFIGEKTVRNHLTSIFSKLNVAHRLELSVYAQKQGLITRNN